MATSALSKPRPEFLPQDPQEFDPWQSRDDVRQLVAQMDPHTGDSAVQETQAANNSWLSIPAKSSATAFSASLAKVRTFVLGTPGTVLKSLSVAAGATAQLTGVRVLGAVNVAAGGVLLANCCRFDAQVQMAAGAKGHFVGCFTKGVNNAGAMANVYIIGCHLDGGADAGCTIVAETT